MNATKNCCCTWAGRGGCEDTPGHPSRMKLQGTYAPHSKTSQRGLGLAGFGAQHGPRGSRFAAVDRSYEGQGQNGL